MRKLSWFFLLPIILFSTIVSAQKSAIYTYDLKDFDKALALYNDKQYASAQLIFEYVKNNATTEEVQSDCAYYIANCAIRTNKVNADALMEKFVHDYPTSTKQNQAYIEVAQYFFEQGNYPKALQWFDKVDETYMSKSDSDKFNFQKGYSYFTAKKKKEATVTTSGIRRLSLQNIPLPTKSAWLPAVSIIPIKTGLLSVPVHQTGFRHSDIP